MEPIVRDYDRPTSKQVAHQSIVYPVILCGGSGKRLWPVSRHNCPKQFQRLNSKNSLIQETVLRARETLGLGSPIILCNAEHRHQVVDHMSEIGVEPLAVVCEPVSRNTGPALCVAAMILKEHDPNAIMLVMPSDHFIADQESFAEAFRRAKSVADGGFLATFGIKPDRPETGYGYIEQGDGILDTPGAARIARFIEKPNETEAIRLIERGGVVWNSGMFVFPVEALLKDMERLAPDISNACDAAIEKARSELGFVLLPKPEFSEAPDESIDVAVMEKTDKAVVVFADMGWSDIGTWPALLRMKGADEQGNVIAGNTLTEDVSNCLIQANGRLVAAVGLSDLVIVDTEDALLISAADRADDVDGIVMRLRRDGQRVADQHAQELRPWGAFETVDADDGFQVKHIVVKPGHELSLQMHHHRAEHWIVVRGTARVTCGDQAELLHENETVHIPLGTKHRLKNPGKIPLHLIEVQVGSYLGEDDIVRFDDRYGRIADA